MLTQAVWPRIAVALIATLLLAWFLVLARDQHVGKAATDRIADDPRMSRAAWDRVMADLERADLLDPSTDWDLTRANYLLLHDRGAARRQAESIVRREPDNLGAWMLILDTNRDRDPTRAARAEREVRRLNPLTTAAP